MKRNSFFKAIESVLIGITFFALICIVVMQLLHLSDHNSLRHQISDLLSDTKEVESVSTTNFVYKQLDEETKKTYDEIYDCVSTFDESRTLSTKDSIVLQNAFEAMMADYGDLFWFDGYSFKTYMSGSDIVGIEFCPKYTMSKNDRLAYQARIDAVVDEWVSETNKNASDFDKALFVYETLIKRVDYNKNSKENQNIISSFLYRSTVCQGYTNAAWLLLKKLGIESCIITGYANNENHTWNLVKIDGLYYFMDVTWGNSKYLDTNLNAIKKVNYSYFAMTSNELEATHTTTSTFKIPLCASNAANYFVHEGLYYTHFDERSIGNKLKQSYINEEDEISIKFSESKIYTQFLNYFIEEKHISDFCNGINTIYYLWDDNSKVITIQWK